MEGQSTRDQPTKGGKRLRKQMNKMAVQQRWKKARDETLKRALIDDVGPSDAEDERSQAEVAVAEIAEMEDTEVEVAAKRKIRSMEACRHADDSDTTNVDTSEPRSWCIVDLCRFGELLKNILCPSCAMTECLQVVKGNQQAMGFSESLQLFCSEPECDYRSEPVFSSPRAQSESSRPPFEINSLMTMLSHELGKGHECLQKFRTIFGMKNMHLKTYQHHQRKVFAASAKAAGDNFYTAANLIRAMSQDLGEDGEVELTVSYDGTWQKRGFTSHHGMGIAIEVNTGLVIDREVLSNYCQACAMAKSKHGDGTQAFTEWKAQHTDCEQNFLGSSKAMETEAAKRIWSRSVELYGFRYMNILSDGDASTYSMLQKLNPYGEGHPVKKLDCVNHAEKRLGTALRKISKDQGLGGRGKGRLTMDKADKLQRYYGRAIRSNVGDPAKMRTAIWASFLHSMSTDKDPHHSRCPTGEESWCIFRKAAELGKQAPKNGPKTINTWLEKDVARHLIPIYERMSDASLLERMTTGGTQNANESLNNLIWVYCPKTVFVGRSRVVCAVDMAFTRFNAGAKAMTDRMHHLGIEPTEAQIACMVAEDDKRIKRAEKAAEELSKQTRKMRQTASKRAVAQLEAVEGPQYGAGQF